MACLLIETQQTMNYKTLTDGEISMIKAIAESDFRSGADLLAPVWQPTESKQDRGYLGSLVKKGLAGVDNTTKGEETAWLTETGAQVYTDFMNAANEPKTELQKYNEALADYLKELNEQKSDHEGYIFEVERGRKYDRITMTMKPPYTQKSAFCFVEKETGAILKADSWSTPAKKDRGSIFDAFGKRPITLGSLYIRK